MNEIELKNRFINYIKTNNLDSSFLSQNFKPNNVIEIKNEGLNKKFDLILALIKTKEIKTNEIKNQYIEIDEDIKSIFIVCRTR